MAAGRSTPSSHLLDEVLLAGKLLRCSREQQVKCCIAPASCQSGPKAIKHNSCKEINNWQKVEGYHFISTLFFR